MIQDKEGMRKLTKEISAVIERNLRAEILHERKAMLEAELVKVRAELAQLGAGRPAPSRAKKPVSRVRRLSRPGARTRRMQGSSARSLIIETLKRTKRPMTITELTKTILRKGWKSERKNPSKTVDVALRHNPDDFRRTAPSTFELNQ
jgi:hypothetical protein